MHAFPSWDDIRFFLAIHRAGSLSAASGPLGVTQPTCGRRLSALEATLGVRLFHRTPEGLRITEAGTTLLPAANAMEQGARELALAAMARDKALEGTVCIATNDLFASTFVVGALPVLRAKYPSIRIKLAVAATDADLLARDADLAFRFRPRGVRLRSAALVASKLGDEPFLLYGADVYLERRGPPSDPADLRGHDVVAYAGPHPASKWCEAAFRDANVMLSASSMHTAAQCIAEGLGLGVLPRRAARRFAPLRRLSAPVAHATGWVLTHPDLRDVARIRAVRDTLVAMFRGG